MHLRQVIGGAAPVVAPRGLAATVRQTLLLLTSAVGTEIVVREIAACQTEDGTLGLVRAIRSQGTATVTPAAVLSIGIVVAAILEAVAALAVAATAAIATIIEMDSGVVPIATAHLLHLLIIGVTPLVHPAHVIGTAQPHLRSSDLTRMVTPRYHRPLRPLLLVQNHLCPLHLCLLHRRRLCRLRCLLEGTQQTALSHRRRHRRSPSPNPLLIAVLLHSLLRQRLATATGLHPLLWPTRHVVQCTTATLPCIP